MTNRRDKLKEHQGRSHKPKEDEAEIKLKIRPSKIIFNNFPSVIQCVVLVFMVGGWVSSLGGCRGCGRVCPRFGVGVGFVLVLVGVCLSVIICCC